MTTQRYIVGTRDCDALGHLNVANYFAYCNLAGFTLLTALGWPPGETNRGRRYSFAAVHVESQFFAEVLAGQTVLVRPAIASIGTKSAVFDNLITLEDGTRVFHSQWKSALMDLDSRRAVAVPDDLRSVLEEHLV